MSHKKEDLRGDVVRFAFSDLEHRARVAKTWGIKQADELVARAALRWAKETLKRIGDDTDGNEDASEVLEQSRIIEEALSRHSG